MPNDLAVLARLFVSLGTQSRNIDAWRFYSNHQRAVILLIARDARQIVRSFQADGFQCDVNPVIVLEEHHRIISPIRLSAHLRANGVEIVDAYSCSSPYDGVALVLRTSDVSQTAAVLQALDQLGSQSAHGFSETDVDTDEVEPAQLN